MAIRYWSFVGVGSGRVVTFRSRGPWVVVREAFFSNFKMCSGLKNNKRSMGASRTDKFHEQREI